MQTPAGYAMNDVGQFVVADWSAIIFNPSFPYRLVHMLLGAFGGGLLQAGLSVKF